MSKRCLSGVLQLTVAVALVAAAAMPAQARESRSRALHCLATAVYFEARAGKCEGPARGR